MIGLISICIPTYNRPDHLRQALDSCLKQTYPHFEILIGDDSNNNMSQDLVAEYTARFPGKIKYQRNQPSLGQAGNVNRLFDRALGDRLILLHDDDLLLPDALNLLTACWQPLPDLTAAFGKQYITDNDGKVLLPQSEKLNVTYHRISHSAGRQAVPAVAGLLRMFPNDGYMVSTKVARSIRYRPPQMVGEACDTDFGIRVCLAATDVWFVDDYISIYRLSEDAVSKRNYPQPFAYEAIRCAEVPAAASAARRIALQDLAPGAASGFARLNKPGTASTIYFSRNYRLRDKLSPRGAFHLLLILVSLVRRAFLKGTVAPPI